MLLLISPKIGFRACRRRSKNQTKTKNPKNRKPRMQEAIKKAKKNEMVSYETSYELADGSEKWYDVRWAGITGEDEENMGYVLAFKDITERKLSDMERVRVTYDLVQRNKDLEQFTYIVSHNLRA